MKLTRKILEEASKITEYTEPDDVFNPNNETLIGEMSKEDKQIYTYVMQVHDRGKMLLAEIEKTDSIKEKNSLLERGNKLATFGMFADAIRWAELRSEFKDLSVGNKTIGVRKGFKVVSVNDSTPSLNDFMKRLLG